MCHRNHYTKQLALAERSVTASRIFDFDDGTVSRTTMRHAARLYDRLTFPEVKTPAHPDASHGREAFRNSVLSLSADRTLTLAT